MELDNEMRIRGELLFCVVLLAMKLGEFEFDTGLWVRRQYLIPRNVHLIIRRRINCTEYK